MKYKILDNEKIVDETYLRRLLFEYELGDIQDNIEEYFNGIYDIENQCNMLKIAQQGEFDAVLYYLSTNWQVDVEEINEEIKPFKNGLMYEFNMWLDNEEFTQDVFDKIEKLSDEDKNNIIDSVLDDDKLTQEMFDCFNWYLSHYLEGKVNEQ